MFIDYILCVYCYIMYVTAWERSRQCCWERLCHREEEVTRWPPCWWSTLRGRGIKFTVQPPLLMLPHPPRWKQVWRRSTPRRGSTASISTPWQVSDVSYLNVFLHLHVSYCQTVLILDKANPGKYKMQFFNDNFVYEGIKSP